MSYLFLHCSCPSPPCGWSTLEMLGLPTYRMRRAEGRAQKQRERKRVPILLPGARKLGEPLLRVTPHFQRVLLWPQMVWFSSRINPRNNTVLIVTSDHGDMQMEK